MGLQRFPIGQFSGGINYRDASQELEANEAQDGLNVTLAPLIGTLQERAGKTRFDVSGLPGGGPIDNAYAWYPSSGIGACIIALSINGTIYFCSAAGAVTSVFAGTAGTTWSFVQNEDVAGTTLLWAMNGVDSPKKITSGGAVSNWANTPPNGTLLAVYKNRMIVSGVGTTPQRVFFSNQGDPENPAAAYGTRWKDVRYTEDDTDGISGLQVFADWLLAFKRGSVEGFTNPEPLFDSSTLIKGQGMESRFQSTICEQKCYFFNRSGVWSIDTQGLLTEESSSMSPIWTTITSPHALNFTQLPKVRMMTTPTNRVLCAMPLDGAANNSHVMEIIPHLNFRRLGGRHYILLPALMLHDYPVGAFCRARLAATGDAIIASLSSGVMKLHQLFTGTSDDGVAINSFLFTGWKGFQEVEPFERVRRVNVELIGQVTISTYTDFAIDVASHVGTITSDAPVDPLWSGGTWDGGFWSSPTKASMKRVRPETRARYHAFKFSNSTLNTSFKIFAAEAAFRGGKEH